MNYNIPVRGPLSEPTADQEPSKRPSAKDYFEMIDGITEDLYYQAISLAKIICGDDGGYPEYVNNSADISLLCSLDRTRHNLLSILEVLRYADRGLV